MNLKIKQDKRNYIIIGLCLILVVMGVGYAAFSSLLTINGTANISNSWCVGFDNTKQNTYTAKVGITGGTAPTGSITFSGSTCETKYQPDASLTATFHQPGDQIEYTLTIKNKSTVPVAIKSIQVENNNVTTDTTIKKENIEFIVHMPESTNLAVDGETTMRVVARFQNTTDVTGVYNGEEQSLNVKINAEQGTGTDGMVTTYTGTIYRKNISILSINDNINTTDKIWIITNELENTVYGSSIYNTEADCQLGYTNKYNSPIGYRCQKVQKGTGNYFENAQDLKINYYLKHDIVEDVVTNSYVCFVYNNSEHCLQGGDGGIAYDSNVNKIKDFKAFNNLGAYNYNTKTGCMFGDNGSFCYDNEKNSILAEKSGRTVSNNCHLTAEGNSFCT